YALAWNSAAFRYDIGEKTAPTPPVSPPTTSTAPPETPEAPASIEAALRARMGNESVVALEPAAFGPLYADVVARKLERFGAADYRARASLASAPAAG